MRGVDFQDEDTFDKEEDVLRRLKNVDTLTSS